MKQTWTIFGLGNLIKDIHDAIEAKGQVIRNIVLNQKISKEQLTNIPKEIKIKQISDFSPETDFYLFGFLNPAKEPLISTLSKFNLHFANLVHPFSYIAKDVKLGGGNFIGAGAVIAPATKIGNYNYINRAASIGHDVQLSNFNHVGPGATISGRCIIGEKNVFASGSTIIDGIKIHDNVTVGAGAVVLRDIEKSGTYFGVPAMLTKEKNGMISY